MSYGGTGVFLAGMFQRSVVARGPHGASMITTGYPVTLWLCPASHSVNAVLFMTSRPHYLNEQVSSTAQHEE